MMVQRKSPETLKSLQKAVLRWVLELADYDFIVVHRAGVLHNNADALSRLPQANQAYVLAGLQYQKYGEDKYFRSINNVNWWGVDEDYVCIQCKKPKTTDANPMLFCDLCGKGIHKSCHNPRVRIVPTGPWYCYECVTTID